MPTVVAAAIRDCLDVARFSSVRELQTFIPLATQKVPTTRGLPRPDRGHHVPALTVTSGGRGVGSEVACLVKISRGRERHGIQDVDALIPVTEAETVQGYCPFWEPATWYQLLTTHGTCTLDLRSRSKETSIASANNAPTKEQKVAQGDSDVTHEEGQ